MNTLRQGGRVGRIAGQFGDGTAAVKRSAQAAGRSNCFVAGTQVLIDGDDDLGSGIWYVGAGISSVATIGGVLLARHRRKVQAKHEAIDRIFAEEDFGNWWILDEESKRRDAIAYS